jgi:hypothetical protein
MRRRTLLATLVCLAACRRAPGPAPSPAAAPVLEEARSLIARGDADGALSKLAAATPQDADVLYLQGAAWAAKAETAPAGAGLKSEEQQALSFFDRAAAANPNLALAHLGIAEILAPYALRAVVSSPPSRRGRPADATPPVASEATPERVIQAYRRAAQADTTSIPIVDGWIDFTRKAGRLEEADAAFQELLRRDKENAAPFVRYGDFLAVEKKDGVAAIAQYAQALIWRPSDTEARAKIADIYLAEAQSHYDHKEYATAEARLADAKRYVDPGTPQRQSYDAQTARLAALRSR